MPFFLSVRLSGTKKREGVSACISARRQDDTPPDPAVHLPPQSRFTALFPTALFARSAPFSSALNELNGRAAKSPAHSTHTRYSGVSKAGVCMDTNLKCTHTLPEGLIQWCIFFVVSELGPTTSISTGRAALMSQWEKYICINNCFKF